MAAAYRDHQRSALVEGLALGCLAIGVQAITTNRYSLRGAMAYTAATWSAKDRYPTVATLDLDAHLWSSSYAASSQGARAAWVTGRWLVPNLVVVGTSLKAADVDGDEAADLALWREMATLFVSRLKDSERVMDEPSETEPTLAGPHGHPHPPRDWRSGRPRVRTAHDLQGPTRQLRPHPGR